MPTVGGLNAPCPRLFSCASVAPVEPPLSSNVTPAQKKELDGMTNCPGASAPETIRLIELAVNVAWGKFRFAIPVPGPALGPSGRKILTRGRAVTAVVLRFATERENWVTDRPANPVSGWMSSATNRVIVFMPCVAAPPFGKAFGELFVVLL